MLRLPRSCVFVSLLFAIVSFGGCSSSVIQRSAAPTSTPVNLVVTPGTNLSLTAYQTVQLAATSEGLPEAMSWTMASSDGTLGTVTSSGLFTAPALIRARVPAVVFGLSQVHAGVSVSVQITLSNPAPTVTSILPSSAAANTPYIGTIAGSGFTSATVVTVNGVPAPTTEVSRYSLRFAAGQFSISDVPFEVQVMTPVPGGGSTAGAAISVVAGGMSYDAAARFLKQASWGPTQESVAHVQQIGFSAYLDEQIALPADSLVIDDNSLHVYEDLWNNGLSKPSQLRQKMMWTWFKVFNTPGSTLLAWASAFPELLQRDAFANFRDLLLDTSLNTVQAVNLSNIGNVAGPNPDQNFARELMQLFSTGAKVLNLDGSALVDENGMSVPMYLQADVVEVSRAVTGWAGSPQYDTDTEGLTQLVAPYVGSHDQGDKTVLGQTLPGGEDAPTDMKAAVTLLAGQKNTAAFMTLRLIHSLVSSNPSPAYVSRITSVWLDDGTGREGNLAAVVKAILLDPEARSGDDPLAALDPAEGRAMDAIEWQISVNRILGTTGQIAGYSTAPACQMNECALNAPSVFGYYSPFYTLPGSNVLAPELSLFTAPALQAKASYLAALIADPADLNIAINWTQWTSLATGDGGDLIDHINHACLNGSMSSGLGQVLRQAFAEVPPDLQNSQAKRLLYLTLMSPEFAVNR